jgi:DNA-binding MarR family transcriptional regulator
MFDAKRRAGLWNKLSDLRRHMTSAMQGGLSALAALELTVPQSMALFHLVERGPLSISQLQVVTGRSQATTSHFVKDLERRGLVARKTDPADKRKTFVHATAKASRLVGQVEGLRLRSFDALIAPLPEPVVSRFDAALDALLEAIGEHR